MAQCSVCKHIGANMQRCESCGNVWCSNCAMKGRGHYPKQTAINKCPYCGKYTVKPAN